MSIVNPEAKAERANNLGSLNGIDLVLVSLQPDPNPTEAILSVHFHNENEIVNILAALMADPNQASTLFPISGGHRILGGPLEDQVHVVSVAPDPLNNNVLDLTVRPIGDYSTYTLGAVFQNIDPIFQEIDFKFRPGCFNNCPPDWEAAPVPLDAPEISYLAKDYGTFRHTMINWMMRQVPGWQPTSEADLDQVILELFSVGADELSDFQDRVMNEAYLGTARKRITLARHAQLMDYHIHQGNQASTWLALEMIAPHTLMPDYIVATTDLDRKEAVVFMSKTPRILHPLLNGMRLYTWSGSIPALEAGSTAADLQLAENTQIAAETVQDLIRARAITHLLIQEHLNPLTGEVRGVAPDHRQVVRLLEGDEYAEARQDPLTGDWFVHVDWDPRDPLQRNYCFMVDCEGIDVEGVSLFHGNLVEVHHGRPVTAVFKSEAEPLLGPAEQHYARNLDTDIVRCPLPVGPLSYLPTPVGGEIAIRSTLEIVIESNGQMDPWDEVSSLVHSDDTDERGDHFVVETDELGRSLVRFGNGINGKKLPDDAIVHCRYQIGDGPAGNVGADQLNTFDPGAFPEVAACWNPFDVTNGKAPEPVAEIIRRVPEAYRFRQLRAITLQDYVDRAEEIADVSRAAARYMWTGSWRTVRVTIDPAGTTELSETLIDTVSRHLEAVRLIGEDLEIRPPRFVPLDVELSICIDDAFWAEDVRFVLEQAFSEGYLPDGGRAFFHPDRWTFGQTLHVSEIIGWAQQIEGVDRVIDVSIERWGDVTPGNADHIDVLPNEIIRVQNDRDHMEEGIITFTLQGGRQ